MTRPARKAIPEKVKRLACEARLARLLGLPAGTKWEYDHAPPIALRPVNEAGDDTIPPMNDPAYIWPLAREEHAAKTNGSKATSYGSDKHAIAKANRLMKAREALNEVETRTAKPKRKIPSRPFPEAKHKFQRAPRPKPITPAKDVER
jgi:hypothetical protein